MYKLLTRTVAKFYFARAKRHAWGSGYWELYTKGWKWHWMCQ